MDQVRGHMAKMVISNRTSNTCWAAASEQGHRLALIYPRRYSRERRPAEVLVERDMHG
jgi:hypothetical protein